MKIAVIGVGNMGGAVARRLATGGYDVRVTDLARDAVTRCTAAGATAADDAHTAVADAEVVFTSLPMPDTVVRVWRDVTPYLARGTIAVDISTIDPATAEELTAVLADRNHAFVHCALGKTPAAAEQGAIPLFTGGPAAALAELAPVFERMGERTYDFGSPAAAAVFKLVSNMIGMTNVAALAEGFTLAERFGIDPGLFAAALDDTGARSFQSEVRLPWMAAGDDAARFGAALAAKDVRLAVDAAARLGIPTPVSSQTLAQLIATVAHGRGERDVVAMRTLVAPPDDT